MNATSLSKVAGAISKWRIELPNTFREFDYDLITDVVMHLRYTALDGGDKLRAVAADWVQTYVKSVEVSPDWPAESPPRTPSQFLVDFASRLSAHGS